MRESALATLGGSPAYLPPFLNRDIDRSTMEKIDVWSAGVTLYTILVGRYPFDQSNLSSMMDSIESGQFVIPDSVDHDAADLIYQLLAIDASDRISVYAARNHVWLKKKIEAVEDNVPIKQTDADFYDGYSVSDEEESQRTVDTNETQASAEESDREVEPQQESDDTDSQKLHRRRRSCTIL
jgi:serine/threonine protein kinase